MVLAGKELNTDTRLFLSSLPVLQSSVHCMGVTVGSQERKFGDLPVGTVREGYDKLLVGNAALPAAIGSSVDVSVASVPCRLYKPREAADSLALCVYFHGGGHTQGTLDGYDPFLCSLCAASQMAVLSVAYRLGALSDSTLVPTLQIACLQVQNTPFRQQVTMRGQ